MASRHCRQVKEAAFGTTAEATSHESGTEAGIRQFWKSAITVRLFVIVVALVMAVVMASVSLTSCAQSDMFRITSLQIPNRSGKLPNGLRLIIQPDKSQALVTTVLRYEVGAAEEPADKRGLAHLVEHLAFRLDDEVVTQKVDGPAAPGASDTASKDPADDVAPDEVWIHYLVDENAYTTFDETVYHRRTVPAHLEDVLASFADQMQDFTSRVKPAVFSAERNVVRNERRERYEASPLSRWYLDLFAYGMPSQHPYQGDAVIGTDEKIASVTQDDVGAFLRRYYVPANATLVITGPVQPDDVQQAVLRLFGSKPAGTASVLTRPQWQPSYHEQEVVVPTANETLLTIAWPIGARDSDDVVAMELLNSTMGGWFSQRIASNRQWAWWVAERVIDQDLDSFYVVNALLRSPDDLSAAKDKIFEIADIMSSYMDEEDLSEVRIRRTYSELRDAEQALPRAEQMGYFFAQHGKPNLWVSEFDRRETFDTRRIRAVARRLLVKERAFVMVHTPKSLRDSNPATDPQAAAAATTASAPPASSKPSFSAQDAQQATGAHEPESELRTPAKRYAFTQPFSDYLDWGRAAAAAIPPAREVTLANGVRCRIVQTGTLPLMSVELALRGGRFVEEPSQSASLSSAFSQIRGDSSVSGEDRYRLGVSLTSAVHDESASIGAHFPSFYAGRGLDLMMEVVRSPGFNRKDVVAHRESMQAGLKDDARDLDELAARAAWRARGISGRSRFATASSIDAISLSSIESAYERSVFPENVVVAVSSDLPAEQVVPLLEKSIGSWKPSKRPPLPAGIDGGDLAAVNGGATKPQIVIVDVENTSQSHLRVVFPGPGWSNPRAAQVSRAVRELLDNRVRQLREALGVTYGVHTSAKTWRDFSWLQISANVERAATSTALHRLLKLIGGLRGHRVDEGELDFVRRALLRDDLDLGESHDDRAENLAVAMLRGRAVDFRDQLLRWATELTAEEVNAAIDAMLDQDATVVIVGQSPDDEAGLVTLLQTQRPKAPKAHIERWTPADLL